uniref:Kielin cysteine rich BMP regulator n=1 Tax=Sphenodon punctatus TaxID=8508 RepID=A0A8D0GN55_SPHPU
QPSCSNPLTPPSQRTQESWLPNSELLARVKALEGCECRPPPCLWGGRRYEDGATWEKDACTACVCARGQPQCVLHQDRPHCLGCIHEGQSYRHGDAFSMDICTSCRCLAGTVQCQRVMCPELACQESYKPPGECCPVCRPGEEVELGGRGGRSGEGSSELQFASRPAPCLLQRSLVRCSPIQCPPSRCPQPLPRAGQCCPTCPGCRPGGGGALWCAPGGDAAAKPSNLCIIRVSPTPASVPLGCRLATALEWRQVLVHWESTRSAPWRAPSPSSCACGCHRGLLGGLCCFSDSAAGGGIGPGTGTVGRCQAHPPANHTPPLSLPAVCVLDGVEFEDGTEWEPDGDPCSTCTCLNGEPVCGASQCPPVACQHPAQLLGACCPSCDRCAYNQRVYSNGQEFPDPDSPCQHCQCLNGSVYCSLITCPTVICPRPEKRPGHCCPKCPDCTFESQVVPDGKEFSHPRNPCQACVCHSGELRCTERPCPGALCPHPLPGSCCQNNCNGCNYAGKEYPNGAQFPHPTDRCRECHCINGHVQCLSRRCPPLLCPEPFLRPEDCCPQCPVKWAGLSVPYWSVRVPTRSGLSFPHPPLFPCPRQSQASEMYSWVRLVSGAGREPPPCSVPRGCFYKGKELPNGEQFPEPGDPCSLCSCWEGSVSCQPRACPLLECPFPAPGPCCQACEGGLLLVDGEGDARVCVCAGGGVWTCQFPCPPQGSEMSLALEPGDLCPTFPRMLHFLELGHVDSRGQHSLTAPLACPTDCAYLEERYLNGQEFPDPQDACSRCSCLDGFVTCAKKPCYQAGCSHPISLPGQCCPVCQGERRGRAARGIGTKVAAWQGCTAWSSHQRGTERQGGRAPANYPPWLTAAPRHAGCFYNGITIGNGQSFANPAEPHCSQCTCRVSGAKVDPGNACSYQGQRFQSNEHWQVDACTSCTCLSGEVHCRNQRCPPATCAADETPALIPGMCCPHCIPRPAACVAFGDPHYRTFDGKMLHFQGACTYVLAQDCDAGDFSIHVTNDDRGRQGVSWTKEVAVLIGDTRVQLLQDWLVLVDSQTVTLPFLKEPHLYIERKASTILCPLPPQVLWNGRSHLELSVPGTYKGQTCGLCGNFNSFPQDDLRLRSGQLATSEAAFGNSWKVPGANSTGPGGCADGADVDPCRESGYRSRREANARCKVLKSRLFERCHVAVPPEPFFAACVYDLCACGAAAGDECLCDALEAYAAQCRHAGLVLHWRTPTLCAVGCPQDRGYVFDECGPPCPKTCFNHAVPLGVLEAHCFKPCVPGCQCPAGLVEHQAHCILPEACPRTGDM